MERLKKSLEKMGIDTSLIEKLDDDKSISCIMQYIFSIADESQSFDVNNLKYTDQFIYSRRIIMASIFNNLSFTIFRKFGDLIANSIFGKEDSGFESFFPEIPHVIYYNNGCGSTYQIDSTNINSYISGIINRTNINEIAHAAVFEYMCRINNSKYISEELPKDFNLDLSSIISYYTNILDVLGAIAILIQYATMYIDTKISIASISSINNNFPYLPQNAN